MPRFIDVHGNLKGAKLMDVQTAHEKDLRIENKYSVKFLRFWVDEEKGAVFCLSDAPNREAPTKAHAEAHGLLPDETFEVLEGA